MNTRLRTTLAVAASMAALGAAGIGVGGLVTAADATPASVARHGADDPAGHDAGDDHHHGVGHFGGRDDHGHHHGHHHGGHDDHGHHHGGHDDGPHHH